MTSSRLTRHLPLLFRRATSRGRTDRMPATGAIPGARSGTATLQATIPASDGPPREVTYRVHSRTRTPVGGEARPVFVLVHGIGMSHRYFARLEAELMPSGDTVVLDLPGFGGTPTPDGQLGVADYAAVLARALDDAGLSSCIVIGHSMGAQFVTELAVQRPELVSAVVLIGPVTDTSHPSAARNALVLALDTLLERPITNLLVGAAYLRCGLRWYLTELPVMLGYRLDDRLTRVHRPVLILRGSLDPIATRAWCTRLARAARDGRVLEVPGQPHAVHRAGARIVAGMILDLVDGLPSAAPALPGTTAHTCTDDGAPPARAALPLPRLAPTSPTGGSTTPPVARPTGPRDWRSITVGDRQCRAYLLDRRPAPSAPAVARPPRQDPVFVLIHGIGMSHRYFLRLGEQLAPFGTVLLIDLPGYGWTRRPSRGVSNPAGAEILAALLDDLGVSSCTVVGHSMGAQTATELSIQRPDLVSGLVLIGAAVDARRRTVPEQALRLGLNSILEKPLLNMVQFLDVLRCGPRWYVAELAVAMAYPLEERLPRVDRPVLVLRGSRDLVAGTRWSRGLADSSRDGALIVVDGAPHAVHHRSPADVAAHILTFIDGTDPRLRRAGTGGAARTGSDPDAADEAADDAA